MNIDALQTVTFTASITEKLFVAQEISLYPFQFYVENWFCIWKNKIYYLIVEIKHSTYDARKTRW